MELRRVPCLGLWAPEQNLSAEFISECRDFLGIITEMLNAAFAKSAFLTRINKINQIILINACNGWKSPYKLFACFCP